MEITITCTANNKHEVLKSIRSLLSTEPDIQICVLLSKVNAFKSIRINSNADEMYVGELGLRGYVCNSHDEVLKNTSKIIEKYI